MRVSYPQYLRLKSIQAEVIRMDKMIRSMVDRHALSELALNPHWSELLELYENMNKMLPEEYLKTQQYVDPMALARP